MMSPMLYDVDYIAKIQLLKQFTTVLADKQGKKLMLIILQRYNFWSNSQRETKKWNKVQRCWLYCKDTTFEAIHNSSMLSIFLFLMLIILQRYNFWSNSQLLPVNIRHPLGCWLYCKDTTFEAIHKSFLCHAAESKH